MTSSDLTYRGENSPDLGDAADNHHDETTDLDDNARTDAGNSDGTNVLRVGSGTVGGTDEAGEHEADSLAAKTAGDDSGGRWGSSGEVGAAVVVPDGFDHAGNHTTPHGDDGVGAEERRSPLSGIREAEPWTVGDDKVGRIRAAGAALLKATGCGDDATNTPGDNNGENDREKGKEWESKDFDLGKVPTRASKRKR